MLDESRINIYEYLYGKVYNVVTKNVYSMREPQDLSRSDTLDGFVVIHVGDINDRSEFNRQAYGWARCYIEAFVPQAPRGRLDIEKYRAFEDGINDIIYTSSKMADDTYSIDESSVLSMDGSETRNANNAYYTFIKSFIVNIDKTHK